MQVIIDGYNLIAEKSGLSGNLQAKRERLLTQLSAYRRAKGHPVTVVFDGWRSGESYEHEESVKGISVIYSRHGERADAVIARLAKRSRRACVVVTSDRELQRQAQAGGATAIFSGEFVLRLQEVAANARPQGAAAVPTAEEEPPSPPRFGKKKGNPRKRSKQERRRQARLRKL